MTEPREMSRHVRQWIEKAEHDLRNAEHTLTLRDEDCPFDTVCFHAQQCVEKYLKGWLSSRRLDIPRSHDLVVLLNLALANGFSGLSPHDIQPLNRYTIEARYPGDWVMQSRLSLRLDMPESPCGHCYRRKFFRGTTDG